jgi:hypothetical protein
MDFVSIVFDNKIEINLLKLQLITFRNVDIDIINTLFIVFNDDKHKIDKWLGDILECCPVNLRGKIQIVFPTDLDSLPKGETYVSNWYSQQFTKLAMSKIIKTEYYVVLDAKNHFIKPITNETFFREDGKIKLYQETHNDDLLRFYSNCFRYFGMDDVEEHNPFQTPCYIQTTTPFVFITNECKNMITYIEKKENTTFYNFFYKSCEYTEFFLYFAYLCFNKNTSYCYLPRQIDNVIVGPADPNKYEWNSWHSKSTFLETNNPSCMSVSSKCVNVLDTIYKQHLIQFYHDRFHDDNIDDIINQIFNN